MALDTKVGSFLKPAGGTTGTQSVTGVGFQPKAVIVWTTGGVTSGTWRSDVFFSFGYAIGNANADQRVIGCQMNDAAAAADVQRIGDDKLVCQIDSAGTVITLAALFSLDEDGFTLNWTINDAGAPQFIMHYMALGGDDITNQEIIQWTTPTSTGDHSVTGVGFQPDFLMHLYYQGTAFGGTAGNGVAMGIGMATNHVDPNVAGPPNATSRMVVWSGQNTSDPIVANRAWKQTFYTIDFDGSDDHTTVNTNMTFDSDGFTMDFDTVPASPFAVATLCLKGPQFRLQNLSKNNSGADPTVDAFTGIGFQPEALFIMGTTQNAPPGSSVLDAHAVFGASDGTTEGFATFFDDEGLVTSDCQALSKTDKVFAGTTTIGALDFEGDLTSFDADGFTITWSTNDTNARRIIVLAVASTPEGGEEPPPEPPPEEPLPEVPEPSEGQPSWEIILREKFTLEQIGQLWPVDDCDVVPIRAFRWGRNIRKLRQIEFAVHPSHSLASGLMTLHNWIEVRRNGQFEALFLITDFALDAGGFVYQRSSQEACSGAWVGGQGEGRDRRVIYRDDPSVEAELGRVEKFVSRTDIEYREVGKLREAGDHILAQQNQSLLGMAFTVGRAEAVETLSVRAVSATQVLTHRAILPDAGTLKLGPVPLDRILRDNLTLVDGGSGNRHTLTFTHEASGPTRLAVVAVHTREDASQSASVVYGVQGMTFRVRAENANTATEIWTLKNPDVGEQLVEITLAGSESFPIAAECITYNGVDQTTPVSGATGATGYSSTPAVTVPAAPAGTIVAMFAEFASNDFDFEPTSSITQEIFDTAPESAGRVIGYWRYGRGPSFTTPISAAAQTQDGSAVLASWAAAAINIRKAAPSSSARALDHLDMVEDMDTEFGTANAVMRKYVNNNLIQPRDSARILVPAIALGEDITPELDLVHKGGRLEPVLEMLQEIATEKDFGFEVTIDPDTDNSLLFDLIPITDKTSTVHLSADAPLATQPYRYREHWDIGDRVTVEIPTLGLAIPIVIWDIDITLAPGQPDEVQLGLQTNLKIQDAMRSRLKDIGKRH